ncbi:MAG: hypothetical protein CSB01_01815 [Bacteroidia bacterium]|nr:MAG: hypothetical protein CSB01_01815 [Bacteroidia bacterium]
MKHVLIFSILTSLVFKMYAQQNLNAHFMASEQNRQMTEILANPSLLHYSADSSYADVCIFRKKEHFKGLYNITKGNKQDSYHFNAESIIKKDKSIVWGKASYQNGKNENLRWNTTSDTERLYPYIVADTMGGNLHFEHYLFSGAYSRHIGRFSFGIRSDYRAGMEYRKLDPRPKNDISDLKLSIGTSLALGTYRVGIHFAINKYQQQQHIKVFRPGSGIKIYYLRGMGISDRRFSSVIKDNASAANYFDENTQKYAFQFISDKNNGFFGTFGYKTGEMELTNSIADIIHCLDKEKINSEVGYQWKSKQKKISCKIYASQQENKGTEYNYDLNGIVLSKQQKYTRKLKKAGLAGIVSRKKTNKSLEFGTNINLFSDEEQYYIAHNLPYAIQKYKILNVSLFYGFNKQFAKAEIGAKCRTAFFYCADKEINTSNLAAKTCNETLVVPNFNYISSDKILLHLSLRYARRFNDKMGMYLQTSFSRYYVLKDKAINIILPALGLVF